MANTRTFSAMMSLKDYANNLNQPGGTSPDLPVGEHYGSFLGAYLTHHLQHPEAGKTPEEIVDRDKSHIQQLVKAQNCQITFRRTHQLPAFYNFLKDHLSLYHTLVEMGFLKVDAQCDNGDTFLNVYFREVTIDTVGKIEQALALLRIAQPCLAIANKANEFPLFMLIQRLHKELHASYPFDKNFEKLINAFALADVHQLETNEFMNACVRFYEKNIKNPNAVNFIYQVVTQAVRYGASLDQPIKSMNGSSFLQKMITNGNRHSGVSAITLRAYYGALTSATRDTLFTYWPEFTQKFVENKVENKVENGVVTGVVRHVFQSEEDRARHQSYALFQDKKLESKKAFDIFTAAALLPASFVKQVYFDPEYHGGVVGRKIEPGFVFGASRLFASIPEGERCGIPTKTNRAYGNNDLYVRFYASSVRLEVYDRKWWGVTPGVNLDVTQGQLNKFYTEYHKKVVTALLDDNNYVNTNEYYKQVALYTKTTESVNALSYYLRNAGDVSGADPRYFYSFERTFKQKFAIAPALVARGAAAGYESKDGCWLYFYSDMSKELTLTEHFNYDTAIFLHLKAVGFDFNTDDVKNQITRLLIHGNYADPAFFTLMQCLRDCGAKFPEKIENEAFATYVTKRLTSINPAARKQACREHFEALKEYKLTLQEHHDYAAKLDVKIPSDVAGDIFNYWLSDAGITAVCSAIDRLFPVVNRPYFNTERSMAVFSKSVKDEQGNSKDLMQSLHAYLKSGDVDLNLAKEAQYYAVYRVGMLAACHALKLQLAQVMSLKSEAGLFKEGGLFKQMSRTLRPALNALVKTYDEKLSEILSMSPSDSSERKAHLKLYFAFIKLVEQDMALSLPTMKDKKIGSERVRAILRKLLDHQLLEERITLDVDAIRALSTLTPGQPSASVETPACTAEPDSDSDGNVEALKQATMPPSAPPLDDEAKVGFDGDDYVPPVLPEDKAEPSTMSPEDFFAGLAKNTAASAKSSKEKPSKMIALFDSQPVNVKALFAEKIKAYQGQIDANFYNNDMMGFDLIELIGTVNKILDGLPAIEEADPVISQFICPLTNKVPLYPCGLGDAFAYFDLESLRGKQTVKDVPVNEETVQLLSNRELMLFFTQLKLLHEKLHLSPELSGVPVAGVRAKF